MVCERMVDLDEGFQEWRYRHVKMVERTIGGKTGTGGSPGAAYLHRPRTSPPSRPLVGPQRAVIELDDLRRSPNALAADYSAFRVADRLLLTGHSHQAWPDVARRGSSRPSRTRRSGSTRSGTGPSPRPRPCANGLPAPARRAGRGDRARAEHARARDAVPVGARPRGRPRLVTSDGEFHTLRRQLAPSTRRGSRSSASPPGRRDAGRANGRGARRADERRPRVGGPSRPPTSSPGSTSSRSAAAAGAELLVDAYHALGAVPSSLPSSGWSRPGSSAAATSTSSSARATASCACRRQAERCDQCSPAGSPSSSCLRPSGQRRHVGYPSGGARFAGSTYDPTSHYRRASSPSSRSGAHPRAPARLVPPPGRPARGALRRARGARRVMTRDRSARSSASAGSRDRVPAGSEVARRLAEEGVQIDARGRYFRPGPAPYLSDSQLEGAMDRLERAVSALEPR